MRFARAILIYWFFALTLIGLILTLRGECFADVACQRSEHRLAIGLVVIAAVAFPFVLRFFGRRSAKAGN